MYSDYKNILNLLSETDKRIGKKVNEFLKEIPNDLKKLLKTNRKFCALERGPQTWFYKRQDSSICINVMENPEYPSSGDREILFEKKDKDLSSLPINQEALVLCFNEIIMHAKVDTTLRLFIEAYDLRACREDENKYKFTLYEIFNDGTEKVVSSKTFETDGQKSDANPEEEIVK